MTEEEAKRLAAGTFHFTPASDRQALLWITPDACIHCPESKRPCAWWRFWQWLLLGWRWTVEKKS